MEQGVIFGNLSDSNKKQNDDNTLENHEEEIQKLHLLLKEKDKQIVSLQKALENSQELIVNIHQSKALKLFNKYDTTIGKVLPIRIKKNLRYCNKTMKDETSEIKLELLSINTNKKDILFFPMIDWNYRYQRSHHMTQKFAEKGHRIFYFTVTLQPQEDEYRILRLDKNIYQIQLKFPRFFDIYKDKFTKKDLEYLVTIILRLKNEIKINAFCFVMFPTWTSLAIQLKNMFDFPIVADCVDEIQGFSNIHQNRVKEEKLLIELSDQVICSSTYLYHKISSMSKNVVLIPNGGDFKHFNKFNHKLLADYVKPIVGYFGAIAEWFDTDLVEFLVSSRPELTFVFIGDTYGSNLDKLRKFENVFFLGERPYSELPNYLHSFDVCIIPFKINKLTKAAHPIKIYEYFAAGKPVVTTNMPELVMMKDLCYVVHDKNDFLAKLDIALVENNKDLVKKRMEYAEMNTWEKRFDVLYATLENIISL